MEEINLKDLLDYFISKILIIIIITIFCGLMGSIYALFIQTPMYKSNVTLLLANVSTFDSSTNASNGLYADITLNQKLVSTYREIITSKRVLNQVIKKLDLSYEYSALKKMITVDAVSNTEVISVTVKNENPEIAKNIANEVANTFCDEIVNIYQIQNINIIDKAEVSSKPYNINLTKQVAIYLAIGLVLGCVVVFIVYYFDTTLKTKEEIEEKVGLPALGIIPLKKEQKQNPNQNDLVVISSPKSLISEGFRTLRTNLQFSTVETKLKTIAVVSSMQGEGKSFASINLACAFAQAGEKVLLVDCDMRRGRLHKVFHLSNENGFSNLLISNLSNYGSFIQRTEIKNLSVLTMGAIPPNPAELIASSKNAKLLEMFKEDYDIIIYDCVPITGLTDSLIMAKMVDKTIIVASSKVTPVELLQNTKKSLLNVGADIAGVVFNRVETENGIYANKYYGKYYS